MVQSECLLLADLGPVAQLCAGVASPVITVANLPWMNKYEIGWLAKDLVLVGGGCPAGYWLWGHGFNFIHCRNPYVAMGFEHPAAWCFWFKELGGGTKRIMEHHDMTHACIPQKSSTLYLDPFGWMIIFVVQICTLIISEPWAIQIWQVGRSISNNKSRWALK